MLSGPSSDDITDISCSQPSVSEYYQTQNYKNTLYPRLYVIGRFIMIFQNVSGIF